MYLTDTGLSNGDDVYDMLGYRSRRPTRAIEVIGTCCVRIFKKKRYRGFSEKLPVGHFGTTFRFRSIKWGVCNLL